MAKKLYVGNLSWDTTDEGLKSAFEQFGAVEDAFIVKDRERGNRSKGFGFVTMTNDDEADAAIEAMHEAELDGRQLIVNEARPKEESTSF